MLLLELNKLLDIFNKAIALQPNHNLLLFAWLVQPPVNCYFYKTTHFHLYELPHFYDLAFKIGVSRTMLRQHGVGCRHTARAAQT